MRLASSIPGAIADPPASENQGPFAGPNLPPDIGFAEGLIRVDGSIVLADDVVSTTDLTAALAKTETLVAAKFGNVSGSVQLTMGGGNAYYTGFTLTGDLVFLPIVNAVYGGVLVIGINGYGGFTATPPAAATWAANTPPPVSGGPDLWIFSVDATDAPDGVSAGTATLLRGVYNQGYG
jgi:hypothetical protein